MTDEEVGMYDALNALPGEWEKQEDLLIKIRNIESSKEKLQIWSFLYEIEEHLDNMESLVSYNREAFEKVRESASLKKVISYILTFGNILNGGTPKGQADGFNLDILTKLTQVKDNSNKTLLQIICMKIKSEDEDFKPLKKSFECIEEAIKVPSNETKTSIDKYLKQGEANKAILDKISLNDKYCDKARKTIDGIIKRLKKLEEDFKSNLEYAQKTVEYFGYPKSDVKYKKPDDFLQLIKDFLGDLDKSIPVTEAKKAFKGAAEMGKKITDNKNLTMNAVLSGLKSKLGNNS